jgi:hypothetical protein
MSKFVAFTALAHPKSWLRKKNCENYFFKVRRNGEFQTTETRFGNERWKKI